MRDLQRQNLDERRVVGVDRVKEHIDVGRRLAHGVEPRERHRVELTTAWLVASHLSELALPLPEERVDLRAGRGFQRGIEGRHDAASSVVVLTKVANQVLWRDRELGRK